MNQVLRWRMTRTERGFWMASGSLVMIGATWALFSGAAASGQVPPLSELLQWGTLLAVGGLIFACGRWAGDMRTRHDDLADRVKRIEDNSDEAQRGRNRR